MIKVLRRRRTKLPRNPGPVVIVVRYDLCKYMIFVNSWLQVQISKVRLMEQFFFTLGQNNFSNKIPFFNSSYAICIRQEAGYCCIEYSLCSDDNSWSLFNTAIAIGARQDDLCTGDYLGIDGKFCIFT